MAAWDYPEDKTPKDSHGNPRQSQKEEMAGRGSVRQEGNVGQPTNKG
jgi:hypothetical protein